MAKIKVCLDSACINYRMVEDGKLIQQRKEKCDRNWVPPKDFDEEFDDMIRQTKEIALVSPGTFDLTAKKGEELVLDTADRTSPKKNKAQQIADLEKQLEELKKK